MNLPPFKLIRVYLDPLYLSNEGLYFSKAPFEGLIFGGAFIRRGLSTEENLRFKIDWASLIVGRKFTVFALFYFVFEGNFQVQAPGGLYFEGRFNGGFFTLRVWRAYTWRGLFSGFYGNFLGRNPMVVPFKLNFFGRTFP